MDINEDQLRQEWIDFLVRTQLADPIKLNKMSTIGLKRIYLMNGGK